MAFTQAQLDALEAAIAQGVRSVEYSGPSGSRRVTYSSLDEMMRARDVMRRALGLSAGGSIVRLGADKGLGL